MIGIGGLELIGMDKFKGVKGDKVALEEMFSFIKERSSKSRVKGLHLH